MSKITKILFIHHAKGWGGAPNSMIKLINSLDSIKYEVEVLLLNNSIVAEKLAENNINFKVADGFFYKYVYKYYSHSVPGFTKWYRLHRIVQLSLSWILSRYFFAPRILKKYSVDIIHLNSSVLTDWLVPSNTKSKVVLHVREPFSNGSFGIRSMFFRAQMRKYADSIIAISEDNKARINIPERTTVIYNYAEIPENLPAEESYSSKKVLYLGGASYIKGFYTLVDSLEYLDQDVQVMFGGNFPDYNDQKKSFKHILKSFLQIGKRKNAAIKKIYHHPNAIVLGMTHRVSELLNEVCCLISPFSVSHFSRPVIEAYLYHKPAIGSNVKGMDEIIDNEITGLIIEKDNPEKLAAAINYLCNNPKKVKEMGLNGYKIATQKFTSDNIKEFETLYDQLLR